MSNAIATAPLTGNVVKVPAFATWSKHFETALRSGNHVQFAAGDLWAQGKATYGDRDEVKVILAKFDYTPGTLDNYATVAGKFPQTLRRDGLKFNMFVVLSPQADREDIAEILDAAVADHWSIPTAREVNRALKAGKSLAEAREMLKALESGGESDADDAAESDGEEGTSTEVATIPTAEQVIEMFRQLPPAEMLKVIAAFTSEA
jgi:hypothetical protein